MPDCGQCCLQPWEADINNGGKAQITSTTQIAYACETFLGKDSGQSGTLAVNQGRLDQCSLMWVGYDGTGTLAITTGGVVNTLVGGFIAAHAGSNGAATVDGTNSKWTVTVGGAGLYVGGTDGSTGGTGLLTVKNGGAVTAASLHVWNSGTLTGNATVTVNSPSTPVVTVDGTLAPSWTLTVNGNLTFANLNATMQCNVTPDNLNSVDAEVSGAVALNGKLSVTMTGNFTPGARFTLLHATGGLGGTRFSTQSITFPPGQNFTPKINYDANHVYLDLQPNTGS